MKEIVLQRIELENFKGFRSFSSDFDESLTQFHGPNGSGKTTLVDAYLWTLTGKDSSGSESFKVQPVDEYNVTIPHLDTKVKLTVSVDGDVRTFERSLKQKWTTPRGTKDEVLKGNESSYLIDNVPVTKTEYDKKVSELLCEMDDFKLMSSIYQFFSLNVNERRKKLMEMAGEMPDILTETAYPHLYARFVKARSVDGVKRQSQTALKELNARKLAVPGKMSENERNLPTGIDFDALRAEKNDVEQQIKDIDSILQKSAESNSSLFSARSRTLAEIDMLVAKKKELEKEAYDAYYKESSSIRASLSEKTGVRNDAKLQICRIEGNIKALTIDLEKYGTKVQELGSQWKSKNEEQFNEETIDCCPTCKRPFSEDEQAEMRNALVKAFNEGKVGALRLIVKEGESYRKLYDETKAQIESEKVKIAELEEKALDAEKEVACLSFELSKVKPQDYRLSVNEEYLKIDEQINEMKESLSAVETVNEGDDVLKSKKSELQRKLNDIVTRLAEERMLAVVARRRQELQDEAADIAAHIAEEEQILFEIKQYSKAHINMVEEKVSSMFSLVKFQMYESNLTNEGEKEICECLVDGVPYSSNLNTASKMNAGVDIVNAISRWKGVRVPLWIDNKESCTNLIESPTQIITLSVSPGEAISRV